VGAANTLGTLALGLAAGDGSRNYDQILAGIQAGEIKALYLAGEAPPLEALGKLEFLVVQEALPTSNLYDYAHVVFPAASFAETSGAYINLEGRSQSFAAAIPLQGQARPDWWITARLAQAMGAAGFEYASTAEIEAECRAEVSAATAEEVQPALPQSERPGSSIVSSSFPLMLLLERSQFAYRGASLVERIKGMAQVKTDEELVSLHPDDAASLGVANGELARLVSPYGADTFLVRLTADILPGTAYASINPADGSELFPSRLPGQKAYAVRVEKV
jgi:predicted molibdopterin-dependent oxidoreductase YjgC